MKAEIVIGANYGDEGKGLFTDYLCANRPKPIVVMTNGGSQRGHTVELENGKKHVFHHFGSGTFRNAPTYFAKSFILNPMQFVKEKAELESMLGRRVISYMDRNCFIQLPVDIALNWHIEKCRGERHHGSVGCGIWETTYRMKYSNFDFLKLNLSDLLNKCSYNEQRAYLKDWSYKYAKYRCINEFVSSNIDLLDIFLSDSFIDHFIADAKRMYQECIELPFDMTLKNFNTIVFENGQGLMLDQYYNAGDIDHTTPSYTGSIGIANLLQNSDLSIDSISLNYISRTYLTKHGAGKFKAECEGVKFEDSTNVYNEWQEGLRFGELDYDEMIKRIDMDFRYFKRFYTKNSDISKNIIMTHANEVAVDENYIGNVNFVSDTKLINGIHAV